MSWPDDDVGAQHLGRDQRLGREQVQAEAAATRHARDQLARSSTSPAQERSIDRGRHSSSTGDSDPRRHPSGRRPGATTTHTSSPTRWAAVRRASPVRWSRGGGRRRGSRGVGPALLTVDLGGGVGVGPARDRGRRAAAGSGAVMSAASPATGSCATPTASSSASVTNEVTDCRRRRATWAMSWRRRGLRRTESWTGLAVVGPLVGLERGRAGRAGRGSAGSPGRTPARRRVGHAANASSPRRLLAAAKESLTPAAARPTLRPRLPGASDRGRPRGVACRRLRA